MNAIDTFFNELKQRPESDRVAFASFVAISVVVILIIVWFILFVNTKTVKNVKIKKFNQSASAFGAIEEQIKPKTSNKSNPSVVNKAMHKQKITPEDIRTATENFVKLKLDSSGKVTSVED